VAKDNLRADFPNLPWAVGTFIADLTAERGDTGGKTTLDFFFPNFLTEMVEGSSWRGGGSTIWEGEATVWVGEDNSGSIWFSFWISTWCIGAGISSMDTLDARSFLEARVTT
jgi:hypothetical protein